MTLIQFEYIVALDKHRHFAKAAEACFVTQPTLSMQIQKMEDLLGIKIFDRNKHPIEPTELGRKVISQAKIVLQESKKIGDIVDEEKNDIAGELKIGIIPTLSPYLLPLFVNEYLQQNPLVKIVVEELVTEDILQKLKNDQLDIGLLVTPVNDSVLIEKPIFREEFFAYVNFRHKLYEKEKVDSADIKKQDLWLLNEGHCFRSQVLNICNQDMMPDDNRHLRFESGSLEALKRLVDRHGGVTLLPELATLDLDQNSKKKLKAFNNPKPLREISMIFHKGFMRRKLAESVYKSILQSIPPLLNIEKEGNVIDWKKLKSGMN